MSAIARAVRPCPQGGLLHQGWKDTDDAIFHADGSPADGPIALCEVQPYAYAAWKAAVDPTAVFRQIGPRPIARPEWSCCRTSPTRR